MYDPTIGQFISEDPIGFKASDPNLRRYVGNSPTNYVDPNGLEGVKVGPDNPNAETSVKDSAGNTWIISPKYDGARFMSGFMDTSGARKKWYSEFNLQITFIPADPEQANCRVKLAAARQVFPSDDVGGLGKLFVPVGNKQWSMIVNDYLPKLNSGTDYFLGIDPEDAERGTIGTTPALNSDVYSNYPKGRHVYDAFDHAWMRFEFSRNDSQGPFTREYAIGAYCQEGNKGAWTSVLPFRVLLTPNANDKTKFDLAVGVRTPVQDSATFNKARARFWEVINPLIKLNERLRAIEDWIPGVGR